MPPLRVLLMILQALLIFTLLDYATKLIMCLVENNKWQEMVGHRGCIYPCSGEPVLKTKPDGVFVAAHRLPVYLQCSNCGYAPYEEQPELIKRYLERLI